MHKYRNKIERRGKAQKDRRKKYSILEGGKTLIQKE